MARPKTGDTRKMVTLPAILAQAIEDYRFNNRLKTEAEAIRRLMEAGLRQAGNPPAGTKGAPAQGKGLPTTTLGRDTVGSGTAEKPAPARTQRPRAKPAAMSKLDQIRARREQDS